MGFINFTIDLGNLWNLISAIASVVMAIIAVLAYLKWKEQAVYIEKWKLKLDTLKLLKKFKREWGLLINEQSKAYGYGLTDIRFVNSSIPELRKIIKELSSQWDKITMFKEELNEFFNIEEKYRLNEIENYLILIDSKCFDFSEWHYKINKDLELTQAKDISEYYKELGESFFYKPEETNTENRPNPNNIKIKVDEILESYINILNHNK